MANVCSICRRPDRLEIDKALIAKHVSIRAMALQLGASRASLQRHASTCVAAQVARALEVPAVAATVEKAKEQGALVRTVRDRIEEWQGKTTDLYSEAQRLLIDARGPDGQLLDGRLATDSIRAASGVLREARSNLELIGKLTGELQEHRDAGRGVAVNLQLLVPTAPPARRQVQVQEAEVLDIQPQGPPAALLD